jgi:hypothetical protein
MFQLKFKTVKIRIVNPAFDPTFAAVVVEICTLRIILILFSWLENLFLPADILGTGQGTLGARHLSAKLASPDESVRFI